MEKEKCVWCGKETKYDKDSYIHLRYDYIEGVGQLCTDCARKLIYDKKEKEKLK